MNKTSMIGNDIGIGLPEDPHDSLSSGDEGQSEDPSTVYTMIDLLTDLKPNTQSLPPLTNPKAARRLHGQTLMIPPSRFHSHLLPACASFAMHRKRTQSKGRSMNG
jgi:hypothetical protein